MKQATPILLFFCLFFISAVAQESPEIQKLKGKLRTATIDTAKVWYCNDLTREYSKTNFDSMKHYSFKCLRYAKLSGHKKSLLLGYHTVGSAYLILGILPDSCLYYFDISLKLAKETNDISMQKAAMHNISCIYTNLNLFEKSLKVSMDLLKLQERDNDIRGIGASYTNISIVLCKLHRYEEAAQYATKAVKHAKEVNDKRGLVPAYINLSAAYTGLGNNDEAIANLLLAKDLCLQQGDSSTYATVILNIGVAYLQKKDYTMAKPFFTELAKPNIIRMQDPYSNANVFLNLGQLYMTTGKLDSARYCFNEAYNFASSVNDLLSLENVHYNSAELNAKLGKYEQAYHDMENAYAYRDSVYIQEKDRSITEMKIGYEADKKEAENKQLVQQSDLKDTQIKQQYLIIIILGVLLFVIVLGGVYFYGQRRIIAGQREKILEQKLLQMQLNPHFIFNSLQAIQDYIYSNNEKEASRYLSKFARLMRLTLENSRHESIQLKTEIESLENYLALQKLRMGSKLEYSISVSEDIDPSFIELPPMLIQPFVENAVEHGVKMKDGPGHVKLQFAMTGNMLNIKINDDGPGFEKTANLKDSNDHHSLSMQIITERLELFGRKKQYKPNLKITDLGTTQTKGTQVEINLPTEV